MNEQAPKMSVILISPELEKLHAGSLVASVAAAAGMTVSVFITMGALKGFRKDNVASKSFEYAEIGQALIDKKLPLFNDLLQDGKEVGDLQVYACALAMDVMDWKRVDMLDIIDDVIGITAFLNMSQGSQVIVM